MTKLFSRVTALMAFVALLVVPAFAQTSTAGSIAGAVTDQTGAVVPGAEVVIKNNGTLVESTINTTDNGTFNVPSLATGNYTVTIRAAGFKQIVVTDVKVDVAKASTVNVQLEIGAPTETVTIVGSGELLQTQSANVANTVTGRQITDLPYASRNALDIVLFLPGTATVGRPRQSSVNGLPKGALNITLDGVQVQDPLLKNSDGFFTYIQPKTDAIQEVTLSTATPGAESAGAGAVQIKFATRQGTSEFHGSAYIYHRNSYFNSNYWFNNRDLPEDPVDRKAPRARVLLTQPGVRFGGPILIPGLLKSRDRAFFFVNYEEYRLPESTARQRTIFATPVLNGNFTYIPTGSSTPVVRNLFNLAAATDCDSDTAGLQPCPSTIDPTIGALLNEIQASTSAGGVAATSDPNLMRFSFINTGGQTRRFPTVNLTWNVTKNHQLSNVWNYQQFTSVVDFLNGSDPRFPGFPNFGSQASNRFSNSTALISKIGNSISNEARFALMGGTVVFFPETSPAQFANQGGFNLGINAGGVTTATAANSPQRRNGPVQTFSNTLNWVKGNHTWSFGGNYTRTNLFSLFPPGGLVRGITFGIDQTSQGGDPVNALFNSTNFPGANSTQLANARGIYATLVGRMTAVSGTAVADEDLNYTLNGNSIERAGQNAWAVFAQDQWRIRPNVTLNFGLRYELQGPYYAKNNAYTVPLSFENVFGCSGAFNFFNPGPCTEPRTQMRRLEPGSKAYNTDKNNFAPNFGIAYSPDFKNGFLHRIFGDSGQSVIRAGYSIAYNQDGTNVGSTGLGTNPGLSFSVASSTANGTLPIGSLFRTPGAIPTPTITEPTFPFTPGVNDQAVAFSPDLRVGYVQSWTFGIQREIMRDTVFEVRYVGNRAKKLTRLWSINEVNTIENGFAAEFRLAQANLLANNASGIASRSGSFAYFGPGSGTSPLPIFLAYLNRSTNVNSAAAYAGANWRATNITNNLVPVSANVTGAAGVLSGNAGLRANALAAGLPRNFFVINPDLPAGAFIIDNSASSTYDALQVELRRRMSAGLLLQANYTFAHAMSDAFASSSIAQSNFTSIRNPRLNYGLSPFDIRHAFKGDFIYELPFGRGQRWGSGIGMKTNWLLGGWGINGTFRLQSGSPINFGNVQLVNMDRGDLQKMIEIRKNATTVTWLPDDVILNTIRAFSISPTSPTGYSGTPPDLTKPFIAPAGFGNCQARFNGECGITNLVVYGPRFTRIDASLVKKVTFSEDKNLEFRVEALNVINNQNFKVGSFAADTVSLAGTYASPTFGQTTVAYQDTSTTTDPGGRLIQFVLRFNF
ncbi:MAG TPA: TonB-dependent receptor [Pyrinomonadaceae bacterium]|nr:TonB-dependent receptor [Pyrinomonadaceae bacterium]